MNKEEATSKILSLGANKRTQEAIVDLIRNKGVTDKLVHQIPGGQFLTDHQGPSSLPTTIYTWLRWIPDFEKFEISFVGEYDSLDDLKEKGYKPKRKLVENFNYKGGAMPWNKRGLRATSEALAKYLSEIESPLSLSIDKEGFLLTWDDSKSFGPRLKDGETQNPDWNPVLVVHKTRK